MKTIKNKQILVVGLGKSGDAAARFLKRQGASVRVTDSGNSPELKNQAEVLESLGIPVELGAHRAETFQKKDIIVLSPGVPHTLPILEEARKKGTRIIGEIELAATYIDAPVVAITGTNGKSTTTMLVGKMLEQSGFKVFVGGNIGNPLIEYVDEGIEADIVVAEISSFQLDTMDQFRPKVAVLLNITPDHLDRYNDFDDYARSKCRIFENQTSDDFAVLNFDDPVATPLVRTIKSRKLYIDRFNQGIENWFDIPGVSQKFANPPIPGKHNLENIAAAALASAAVGGTIDGIVTALRNFKGLHHRMAFVGEKNGVKFFDDSKATNLDATKKVVESFDEPVVLIMGGRGKGYGFEYLNDTIRTRVKKLVLIGETKDEIAETLGPLCPGGYVKVKDMDQAVSESFAAATPGDIVLLAPACASFDMFTGYAHRGEKFCEAFEKLNKRK